MARSGGGVIWRAAAHPYNGRWEDTALETDFGDAMRQRGIYAVLKCLRAHAQDVDNFDKV